MVLRTSYEIGNNRTFVLFEKKIFSQVSVGFFDRLGESPVKSEVSTNLLLLIQALWTRAALQALSWLLKQWHSKVGILFN